jgi:hypothetical protein
MLRAVALIMFFLPMLVMASPKKVESFDAKSWARLQKELPRPAVVVFTATYCANCPALIGRISRMLKQRGLRRDIVAVVIDDADPAELLKGAHYRDATRIFLFDGNEATLRYGVDPRWRGVTPYVALLGLPDSVKFVAGTPSDAQFDAWMHQ